MFVKIKAYAKLNLTLGVVGREGGYHMLDSLACTVDLFDEIVLEKRNDGQINLNMRGRGFENLSKEKNNAYLAAKAFCELFDVGGVDIEIAKNIPSGAGLGGSSADAAGVLRGLQKLFCVGSDEELFSLSKTLGSDVSYMLCGGFKRMKKRGEALESVDGVCKLHFAVLVPPAPVSTAECYAEYDKAPLPQKSSDGAIAALTAGDVAALGRELFNDLYPAAKKLNPDVERAVEILKSSSPLGVSMTGSGSAVFALFKTKAECEAALKSCPSEFEKICVESV